MSFTSRPELRGTFGMASSTHWLATACAQSVLERGGNAFDAAVAGAFVLHVVEPENNGAGGDLVAIIAPAGGSPTVLSGQGPAPAGATIEHYRAEGLELVPGSGALAAAVPGAVDAWLLLLRDHGTWELGDVLAYAIGYAREGHPAGERLVRVIAAAAPMFDEHWITSRDQWLPGGRVPSAGELLRLERYADTLERLVAEASEGPDRATRIDTAREAWATGFVAQAIAAFVRSPHRHATGGDHAGVIEVDDLDAYAAEYEEPLALAFHGFTVLKPGPWTQGPALLQALGILDGFDDIDPAGALGAHVILEATKLALADRDAYYGDGADIDWLLDMEYLAARRELIGAGASAEFRPGGDDPWLPPRISRKAPRSVDVGEPAVRPLGASRGDTCHIDVVDRWGNMIAATPSGGWLQSSPTIPELGFCLGTRLQMMWLDEDSPSRLEPGKRPRTTLSPTMVLRHGEPVMALGTPGGDQQDAWQLLFLVRTLALGMQPQAAIDAPAFHTEGYVSSFFPRGWDDVGVTVEDRMGEALLSELARRGHAIERAGDWTLGRLAVVTRSPSTGILGAAANPRAMHGYAAGR
jgi:gamma-glutamyltranspeptidase/glutathione hydrolase